MSYYLLTIGSKAPKISYRCQDQRLFTTSLPPANDAGEFKFTTVLREFALDIFKQEAIDRVKWLIEQLLTIF